MAQLPEQFKKAKSNIEPEEDARNAAKAHAEVREVLGANEELTTWGIDTILIGSYAREVSIRHVHDVDVFSKLSDVPDDKDPEQLRDKIVEVLSKEYDDDRIDEQPRSVKVDFPQYGLSVDTVPARPKDGHWEIPDVENDCWIETDPEKLGGLTSKMNKDHDGQYVPTIKLIRQVRSQHTEDHPGGLYFEILTFHAFRAGINATTAAEYFTAALEGIVTQLDKVITSGGLEDPTLDGGYISTRATGDQIETARETFAGLAAKAREALTLGDKERCRAAKLYREILGKTPDGEWVFPMPDDCKEDGTPKVLPNITPGSREVPAGDRRFA